MGCSDIMSAKNGEVQTPPPSLVSQKSEIDLPPLPLLSEKNQKLANPPMPFRASKNWRHGDTHLRKVFLNLFKINIFFEQNW